VQVVVDDVSFPFVWQNESVGLEGSINKDFFYGLVHALMKSKSKYFAVEFPKRDIAETFSLLSVRTALGKGRRTIVEPCDVWK
jgi:hypothetical protein